MEGVNAHDGRKVVLKVLKPARSYKVKREIRVLQASGCTTCVVTRRPPTVRCARSRVEKKGRQYMHVSASGSARV